MQLKTAQTAIAMLFRWASQRILEAKFEQGKAIATGENLLGFSMHIKSIF